MDVQHSMSQLEVRSLVWHSAHQQFFGGSLARDGFT